MKYEKVVTLENLFQAWYAFRKGKSNKRDVMQFESSLEDNIFALHEELSTKTYTHQPYSTFHVYDPKFRVINKATVRDRVVHHLLYTFLEPIFQPAFIYHSYACQTEKGIHKAVEDVSVALRRASRNYTRMLWTLKLDIKKFFDSVDHEVLFVLLRRRVKDPGMRWLLHQVIESYTSTQGSDKGVPIGNLTSQIFANMYLSELDYFAKCTLREHYYFRYADDFLFLHEDRSHLEQIERKVTAFVAERLQLVVHPNKVVYRKFSQGVDFVGYVLLPHYRVLRTKTKRRMFTSVRRKIEGYNAGMLSEEKLFQTIQSYRGLLGHCSGYDLDEQLRNHVWFEMKTPVD